MIKLALALLVLFVFLAAGGLYVVLFVIGLIFVAVMLILQGIVYSSMFLYFFIKERKPMKKRKGLAREAQKRKPERLVEQDEKLSEHRKLDRLAKEKKLVEQDERLSEHRKLDRLAKEKKSERRAQQRKLDRLAKEKKLAEQDERLSEHRKLDRLAKEKKSERRAQQRKLDRLAKEKKLVEQDERLSNSS